MAAKRKENKESSTEVNSRLGLSFKSFSTSKAKTWLVKSIALHNITSILAIIYYLVWIPIGIFLVWFIVANFRVGVFNQLISAQRDNQQERVTTDTPTETTIPGIGKVNIQCVQSAVSEESIMKMVQEKSTANLSTEDKQKLEPCILEKDSSSPNASPSPAK